MYAFTTGSVLIAIAGLGVGMLPAVAPELAAKLLRYYWFRLSDVAVPLMFALLVMRMATDQMRGFRRCGFTLLLVAIAIDFHSSIDRMRMVDTAIGQQPLARLGQRCVDRGPTKGIPRLASCMRLGSRRDGSGRSLSDATIISRLLSGMPSELKVVNWKDVPQDAKSLQEWYRRFREIFPERLGTVRSTIRYSDLREYQRKVWRRLHHRRPDA